MRVRRCVHYWWFGSAALLATLFFCGQEEGSGSLVPAGGAGISVVYFHTMHRDPTCHKIESLTRTALRQSWPARVDDGTLVFFLRDIDRRENRHYVADYRLTTRSVVITRWEEGESVEWRNLERIYDLVAVPEQFQGYVVSEIAAMLAR